MATRSPTWAEMTGFDPADPFRYGWRYVSADGGLSHERVPLTLADVLHPQEEDFIVQSVDHQRRSRYLADVLEVQVAHDPTAVVLYDVRIAWGVDDLAHGPDVAVYFGVRPDFRERRRIGTFDVAEEGVRPVLIIEVTSPSTAGLDRSAKLEEYELVGLPFYVIVDATYLHGRERLRLVGYRHTGQGFEIISPDGRGWLWLEPVRAWIGIVENEVYCFDESGRRLGSYPEEVIARRVAEGRAEEAEGRAEEAEGRAATAEGRAMTAEGRAVAAEDRADAEAAAREAAEARLAALEAELRRLRGA